VPGTLGQFLAKHKLAYNYQIIDGDPIRVVRRAINADLVIDAVINQADCIKRDKSAPAIKFSRIDPITLPRQVDFQYVDPNRLFATNVQTARRQGASIHNGRSSVQTDFIHDSTQAMAIANDILDRLWTQQLSAAFEHPDLRLEGGDVVKLVADQGTYVMLILGQSLTPERTNQIQAVALLVSAGISVPGGNADEGASMDDYADWIAAAA